MARGGDVVSTLTEDAVVSLIDAATRAPSSHNSQPWLFIAEGDTIDVVADRTRALPVNDPFDRELTISCGAALFNLRVAAEAAGLTPRVAIESGDGDDQDLLATVTLRAAASSSTDAPSLAELASTIPRRRTHRGPLRTDPLPTSVLERLDAVATRHGVSLRWVGHDDDRDAIAALVAEGDRTQFSDPSWRRELASWMHPRRQGDGLAVFALAAPAARFVVSHFDLGHSIGGKDEALTRQAPMVAVLVTNGDGPVDWLNAGQALEELLLVAVAAGVGVGYANQPCQVARLRPELRDALGIHGHPQLVLRVGFPAENPAPTPRRPVREVLLGSWMP
jgi:nitroreductase